MIRNEYRRAFIMLRAVMPGYGGHVRLERRTLTGSMYFIITAPQGVGELAAALVGQRDGAYYAAPIGPLSRDRRGQLALAWQFDPRAIEGLPLEAYAWVAIVATGGPCALALTGNVEGSRTMDLRAVEQAACALYTPPQTAIDAPAADLPEREPDGTPTDGETRGDVRIYTMTRARLRRRAAQAAEPAPESETPLPEAIVLPPVTEPIPESEALQTETITLPPTTEPVQTATAPKNNSPQPETIAPPPVTKPIPVGEAPQPEAITLPPVTKPIPVGEAPQPETIAPPPITELTRAVTQPQPEPVTAARILGLDITVPWPGVPEDLRRLFATQGPADDAPRDGFTYVRAPMPEGSGYRESYAGLRAGDGRITGLRYALPDRRAPEPPPGLEGYRWLPGSGESGFWVTEPVVKWSVISE